MKHLQRLLSLLLSAALILLPIMPAQAALINNAQLFAATAGSTDRTALLEVLERDSARQQLSAMGISHDRAMQRIAQMTDQEVAQLNQRLSELPAGGDVLGIIVLIFIIFIITDAIGATDIFPFVHPVK